VCVHADEGGESAADLDRCECDIIEGLQESKVAAFFLFQFRGFVFITVGALKDVYKTCYSDAHVPSLCPYNLYTLTGR
jgi:hypothetical protein